MKIRFRLDFFVCFIVLLFTNSFKQYILFIFFLLVHELSHLIVGIILGSKPKKLDIYAFGFSLDLYTTQNEIKNKIMIILAGPFSNLFIAILLILLGKSEYSEYIYINILLGVFNLLPIYPLDGGRLLKYLLEIKKGKYISYIFVNTISNTIIIILSVLYSFLILKVKNISIFFTILYLWIIVLNDNTKIKKYKKYYSILEKNKKSFENNWKNILYIV